MPNPRYPKRRISKNKIELFQGKILAWFESSGRHHFAWRRKGLTPYQIVIAEVLLQRTKAETIEKFYSTFLAAFPDWATIANIEMPVLEQHLKPVGCCSIQLSYRTAFGSRQN